MTDQTSTEGGSSRLLMWGAGALGLAALVLGAARWVFAMHEPLWFDEAFTLSIVSRPDAASFWRQVYLDSNGPAFYLIERLWSGIAGRSDLALRIPTLLAVWAAGALPLLVPLNGLSRTARTTWGAMIFAWWGVGFFLDARCYGLLLAVATGQGLAYGRVMAAPSLRRALMWMTLGALGVLLHYYMLFLVLTQGLIYLGRHRMAAVRTWPAVLVFAPVATWILRHAPRLADYSRLASVWHPPVDARSALDMAGFVIGPGQPLMLEIVAVVLIGGRLIGKRWPAAAPEAEDTTPEPALTLTAAARGRLRPDAGLWGVRLGPVAPLHDPAGALAALGRGADRPRRAAGPPDLSGPGGGLSGRPGPARPGRPVRAPAAAALRVRDRLGVPGRARGAQCGVRLGP
ncbi:hypothetical protein [Phenylobacterium aquaticum]|uniref:hypothetical protein n=1 Tax=Phenylobacterium aquaticum TaxID=1763816 RepID=UPI001F5C31AD|nr:hypothetical protein [Phenylobacterium aquaticum]MCI3135010.1 hypothetical protein [Phenylobacterium aquaticum]